MYIVFIQLNDDEFEWIYTIDRGILRRPRTFRLRKMIFNNKELPECVKYIKYMSFEDFTQKYFCDILKINQ